MKSYFDCKSSNKVWVNFSTAGVNLTYEDLRFLDGNSRLAKMFRAKDWSKHSLGSPELWDPQLKSIISLILNSSMPMFVTWGPDRSFLYNDIYAKIAGEKFQSALGQKFETVWSEIWDHLLPLVQKVESGESIYLENVKLLFRRSLNEKEAKEEAYFTFSYSPIRSSLGTIDGLFCAVVETTNTVLIQREQSIENADIDLARRKLQESEENLKLAIRGGRLGTWLINFEEERITFDEKTKELHGILHNDDLKDVFTRRVHPGDRYKVNEALYSTLNKGTIFEVEYRAMHSSGNYRWVYARGEPKLNKKGKVISTSGVVSDITERKNAEAEALFERQKLQTIFNESPAHLALWRGEDMVFEMANPTFRSLVNHREIIGKPFLEVLPEIINQPFPAIIRDVFESGKSFSGTEAFVKIASESVGKLQDHYFDFTYVRVNDLSGNPYGVYNYSVDVTERVLARKKLEESEARFREAQERLEFAVESAKMGAWTIEFPSERTLLSEQARQICGFDSDYKSYTEAIDKFIHRDDREKAKANLAMALANRTSYHDKLRIIRPNREMRWIEIRGHAKYNLKGEPILLSGIVVDITEQNNSELALQVAKKEAERANESKSAFLANMSHEIRTPLAAILGFSTLLKDKNLKDEEADQYIDTIARNSNSLTRIIDDILDLAKVESGRLDIEMIPFSIGKLAADVLEIFKDKAREKKINLAIDMHESVPPLICSDPTRLRQILVNLVGNAVKFTSTGGVYIRLMSVPMDNNQIKIRIDVKDTGIGITEDQKVKLFQPFTQADNSMTRKFGGSGLGLALSQRLAQALSGEITITESLLGRGSTFSLTFISSLATGHSHAVPKDDYLESMNTISLKDLKILVVDDSPDNQFLVARLLIKNGAVVQTALDGQEGFKKASTDSYDIILMDLQMPVMDGYQAKHALDNWGIRTPVIALTAHAMSDERKKTHDAGFVGHLTKPIDADELVRTVSEVSKAKK